MCKICLISYCKSGGISCVYFSFLAFFDYAGAGAYVDINMSDLDAIFLSPHKVWDSNVKIAIKTYMFK